MTEKYTVVPMDLLRAEEISGWAYPGEYGIYSFSRSREDIEELMNGEYYACLDGNQAAAGYFCFGRSARIPTLEEGVYDGDCMDLGLGMAPPLCGRGLGRCFLKAGLDFALSRFHPQSIRLSVACFNRRAIRLYEALDFTVQREITHRKSGDGFFLMTRQDGCRKGSAL